MIAVIDYGMGNLRSVQKALEFVGAKVIVTHDPDLLLNADSVVLPGFFQDGIEMHIYFYAESLKQIRHHNW